MAEQTATCEHSHYKGGGQCRIHGFHKHPLKWENIPNNALMSGRCQHFIPNHTDQSSQQLLYNKPTYSVAVRGPWSEKQVILWPNGMPKAGKAWCHLVAVKTAFACLIRSQLCAVAAAADGDACKMRTRRAILMQKLEPGRFAKGMRRRMASVTWKMCPWLGHCRLSERLPESVRAVQRESNHQIFAEVVMTLADGWETSLAGKNLAWCDAAAVLFLANV